MSSNKLRQAKKEDLIARKKAGIPLTSEEKSLLDKLLSEAMPIPTSDSKYIITVATGDEIALFCLCKWHKQWELVASSFFTCFQKGLISKTKANEVEGHHFSIRPDQMYGIGSSCFIGDSSAKQLKAQSEKLDPILSLAPGSAKVSFEANMAAAESLQGQEKAQMEKNAHDMFRYFNDSAKKAREELSRLNSREYSKEEKCYTHFGHITQAIDWCKQMEILISVR